MDFLDVSFLDICRQLNLCFKKNYAMLMQQAPPLAHSPVSWELAASSLAPQFVGSSTPSQQLLMVNDG